MSDVSSTGGSNGAPPATRQYVQFAFYKVDAAWRRLPVTVREAAKREVEEAVASCSERMQVRAYSLVGIRGDADFMFWRISDDLAPFQEAATALLSTGIGPYLSTPYSYLAMTRKSVYVDKTEREGPSRRLRLTPGTAKYLFVYPFVKTRPWYVLPAEERQKMMDIHIRVGRKYPTVKLNTTYSFGLDDQEFVVAFETDEPGDFLDLVMELREAESSLYTLRDTPTFTCVATTVRGMLDALGAPGDRVAVAASAQDGGWSRAASVADLPEGAATTAYVGGEQVALFNAGGTLYAVEARCTHGSGPLVEATIEGSVLTCPWHESQFDLAAGCAVLRGPAVRPPRAYAVRVRDGGVWVAAAAVEGEAEPTLA
ncbi:MAG: chlorite dismutase family protein [Dehalococcoidia bacterium]|nr:chlorite dismutase family protein [Dehalococcoidia bacterium]